MKTVARVGDDKWVGYASPLYRYGVARQRHPEDNARFLLSDVHSRLCAWWVSSLWRSMDLAASVEQQLSDRHLVPAACSARALFEGTAAFVVEGNQLLEEWRAFKAAGIPDHLELLRFRARYRQTLDQPQFGTRIGQREGSTELLPRTNVLTLVTKLIERRIGNEGAWLTYEYLCDAVHPSFGSHLAYMVQTVEHSGNAGTVTSMQRRFGTTPPERVDNPIAEAIVDATALAADQLVQHAAPLRRFAYDFGFTTGVASAAHLGYFGSGDERARNRPCPCGSGRRAKLCPHSWGSA